ncbi:hypothetical protein LPJ61_002852 [Coemansia biformis]|uniref:Uncharacterized protein n=1 Tax=Coemansia biformis TaxID=1286918 RepID=A0A9W7YBN7_9FUNG|nr:hypothetical protein LPJ61_002852 [Coemansia biformis]
MEEFGDASATEGTDVQSLMDSIRDVFGDTDSAPPPRDDRIDKIEEMLTKVTTELDQMKKVLGNVNALSEAQTRLLAMKLRRQDEAHKSLDERLTSQFGETITLLNRLDQQVQLLIQDTRGQGNPMAAGSPTPGGVSMAPDSSAGSHMLGSWPAALAQAGMASAMAPTPKHEPGAGYLSRPPTHQQHHQQQQHHHHQQQQQHLQLQQHLQQQLDRQALSGSNALLYAQQQQLVRQIQQAGQYAQYHDQLSAQKLQQIAPGQFSPQVLTPLSLQQQMLGLQPLTQQHVVQPQPQTLEQQRQQQQPFQQEQQQQQQQQQPAQPQARMESNSPELGPSSVESGLIPDSDNSARGSISPASSEVTIKGSTKHRLEGDHKEQQHAKRQHVSPRVSGDVMLFDSSGHSNSDSGSDDDDNNPFPVRSNRAGGEKDIGIVGASGISIASQLGPRGPARAAAAAAPANLRLTMGPSQGDHCPDRIAGPNSDAGLRGTAASPLRDCSGTEITTDRMSELMGPFTFLWLQGMQAVYNMYYGCQPLGPSISLHTLQHTVTSLDQFCFWETRNHGEGNGVMAQFIQRTGKGLRQAALRIEDRLLRPRAVPSPLLSCQLIMLVCSPIGRLTGEAVGRMFNRVTRRQLGHLNIATANGEVRKSADDIWADAKLWVTDLTNLITEGKRPHESLNIAKDLHSKYVAMCCEDGLSGPDMDSRGEVAMKMFANYKQSRLFLGIRSSDLENLFKYLGYIMSNSKLSRPASAYLKEISRSYIANK